MSDTRRGRIRRMLRYAVYVFAILAACFLAWTAVILPYALSREMATGHKQQAVQTAQTWHLVWLNTGSGIYHRSGSQWYGDTQQGRFLPAWLARIEGNRVSRSG